MAIGALEPGGQVAPFTSSPPKGDSILNESQRQDENGKEKAGQEAFLNEVAYVKFDFNFQFEKGWNAIERNKNCLIRYDDNRKTLDGAVNFVSSVGTVDVTIAVLSTVDALTVGTTPLQFGIATLNQISVSCFCVVRCTIWPTESFTNDIMQKQTLAPAKNNKTINQLSHPNYYPIPNAVHNTYTVYGKAKDLNQNTKKKKIRLRRMYKNLDSWARPCNRNSRAIHRNVD